MEEPIDPNVTAATDAQLLKMAIDPGVDAAVQRSATETFYGRYAAGLYRHCVKVHGSKLRSADAVRAFVGEVIIRFVRSGRFDARVAKRPDEIPNLIKCWLKRKAQWLIQKEQSPPYKLASELELELDKQPADARGDDARASPNERDTEGLRLVCGLSDKDQDILCTWSSYYDSASEKCHVPVNIQNALCKKWGFTRRNSLVKYRGRLVERLRRAMSVKAADAG